MIVTPQQLIYGALRDLGELRPAQNTSADALADALAQLNNVLDLWLTDELWVPFETITDYQLVAGQQSYTIGGPTSGANFTTGRPTGVTAATIILNTTTPSVRFPIDIIDGKEWESIRVQQIPTAIPLRMYYDLNYDPVAGIATIYLWPGPLSNYQLELLEWGQLQQFASLSSTYNVPPGYAQALRKALAVELSPAFTLYSKLPKELIASNLAQVTQQAREAKAMVQTYNAPDALLQCDPMFRAASRKGSWNYAIGDYGSEA
jgi:hypothetical protein